MDHSGLPSPAVYRLFTLTRRLQLSESSETFLYRKSATWGWVAHDFTPSKTVVRVLAGAGGGGGGLRTAEDPSDLISLPGESCSWNAQFRDEALLRYCRVGPLRHSLNCK